MQSLFDGNQILRDSRPSHGPPREPFEILDLCERMFQLLAQRKFDQLLHAVMARTNSGFVEQGIK